VYGRRRWWRAPDDPLDVVSGRPHSAWGLPIRERVASARRSARGGWPSQYRQRAGCASRGRYPTKWVSSKRSHTVMGSSRIVSSICRATPARETPHRRNGHGRSSRM
jgi:hypothetical protein